MSFSSSKIWRLSALSVASTCVSEPSCFATSMNDENINTLGDFKRFFYKNCWGAWASQKANNTFADKLPPKPWYRNDLLSTSIYDQIQTAIADCMTVNNEFNLAVQKRRQNPNATMIVEFSTNPNGYNQNNWNAVVLYNYLAESIWGFLAGWKYGYQDQCIEFVGNLITNHYSKIPNINNYIGTAVQVIKMYAKDLDLYNYVARLSAKTRDTGLEPQYRSVGGRMCSHRNGLFDMDTRNADFFVFDVLTTIDNRLQRTPVNIKINGGKVVEYRTPYGVYQSMTKSMQLSDKKSATLPKYKYQDLTQNKKPKQIHNLHNRHTCHLNSLITALSMSDLFRQALKKVADTPTKTVSLASEINVPLNLCKTIYEIIDQGIDKGLLANNDTNGQKRYQQYQSKLESAFCYLDALMEIKQSINDMQVHGEVFNGLISGKTVSQFFYEKVQSAKNDLAFKPGNQNFQYLLPNLLSRISYELEQYGVENVLDGEYISFGKYRELPELKSESSDWGYNQGSFSPQKFLFQNDRDLQSIVTQALSIGEETTTGHSVAIGPDNKYQNNLTIESIGNIRILPNVLCVINNANNTPETGVFIRSNELTLKDTVGTKKYRLLSEVRLLPNHFVANVRLGNQFYTVDDTQEDGNIAKEENPRGNQPHMTVAVYERCG